MTALFILTAVFGVVEVVSILVINNVLHRGGGDRPPFRLLAQAVGFVAAGLGGLGMTLGGIGTIGFSIVTIISLAILLAIVYKVVLPWMDRRREARGGNTDQESGAA